MNRSSSHRLLAPQVTALRSLVISSQTRVTALSHGAQSCAISVTMNKRNKSRRNGYVHLDADKLERQLQRCGYSNTEFADKAGISRGTVVRIMKGKGVYRSTAQQIAQALGLEDATCLLRSNDPSVPSTLDPTEIGEWTIERYEGRWIRASNELQYRICLMRHRFVAERLGRGKWYDLLGMPDDERRDIESQLLRHPTVCERIGQHTKSLRILVQLPAQMINRGGSLIVGTRDRRWPKN